MVFARSCFTFTVIEVISVKVFMFRSETLPPRFLVQVKHIYFDLTGLQDEAGRFSLGIPAICL